MPFYAVHVGRQTGVFNTWAEAEQQVKGFAGAQFKKFDSVGDAEFFADRGRQAASAYVDRLLLELLPLDRH